MADLGTISAVTHLPKTPMPFALGAFGFTGDVEFDYGTFPMRMVGGGGGGSTIIEVPVVVPAPPSTNGVGDWPMRFVGGVASNVAADGDDNYYMCPANSRLYVRYWEFVNRHASTRTVTLKLADYIVHSATLASGAKVSAPEDFLFVLGPGETIEATIDSAVAGVSCWVSGIESVLA